MNKRIFSTIALLSLLFASIFFAGIYGVIALATIFSTAALFEFYRLMEHCGAAPRKLVGLILGTVFVPIIFYGAHQGNVTANTEIAMLVPAGTLILSGIWMLRSRKIPAPIKQLSTGIGLIYLPFMISFFALLVGIYGKNGIWFCLWIVLTTKFTDVGGLLGGKFFGKHKLAPTISPKKTWEGVAGGVILSMLVSVLVVFCLNFFGAWEIVGSVPELVSENEILQKLLPENFAFPLWLAAVSAIPFSALSVVSDLVESVIKRNAGDKDSGTTIPGMGGALDLLDSLLLVAPVGFVVVRYVIL